MSNELARLTTREGFAVWVRSDDGQIKVRLVLAILRSCD